MEFMDERESQEIETENLYFNDVSEYDESFDPKKIHIESKSLTISNIVDRLEHDEIILDPDYQRNGNLWEEKVQSRLIESLIISIPLPVFYFDCREDEKFEVVDGVQRLTAIKRFMASNADKPLRLQNLEYMSEFNGMTFSELPPNIQRRIREQNIQSYIIMQGTPNRVKSSIFTRINTGGLVLTQAEIRNAIYRGRVSFLLKELAESDSFVNATRGSVSPKRMLDREFVNRFLAFYVLGTDEYKGNLESFLNEVLDYLSNESDSRYDQYRNAFLRSMDLCCQLFGRNAFRKKTSNKENRDLYGVINKPLFDCISVNLARLSEDQQQSLLERKSVFLEKFQELILSQHFRDIISNGTATIENVKKRHEEIKRIILEALND